MGVTLEYMTPHVVASEVKEAVMADARTLAHHWWREPLHFDHSHHGNHGSGKPGLSGNTLLRDADTPNEDDAFMALRDACIIIGHLRRWSEEHNIDWDLSFANEKIGSIVRGAPDEKLAAWLKVVPKRAGVRNDASDDVRAEVIELHRRHPVPSSRGA